MEHPLNPNDGLKGAPMKIFNRAALALLAAMTLVANPVSAEPKAVELGNPFPSPRLAQANSPLPELDRDSKMKLGRKIWQNECGGRVMGLTSWNSGEEFPSLGIGHFIWYPANFQGPFQESFPGLIALAKQRGANPPAVAQQAHAPWSSQAEFNAALNGPEMKSLRSWLANSVQLQTDHIIARSRAALPKMLELAPANRKASIQSNYEKVASTANGVYALIDYVNFKGEGINPQERYNGEGWGLMWVLMEMKPVASGQPAAREFAAAAKRVLDRRIANSPPARGEDRWRQGWHNRCDSYSQAL